jgi:hypothetical protein
MNSISGIAAWGSAPKGTKGLQLIATGKVGVTEALFTADEEVGLTGEVCIIFPHNVKILFFILNSAYVNLIN